MGWHGQKRMWAIKKMEMMDALDITVKRVITLLQGGELK
jgi:hypothetical protein